jgi:ABC-type antimicrobial peptide transport system permease subunit
MLVESLVLSLLGGGLALIVAYAGVKGMLALAMQGVTIDPLSASPSLPVLGFALAVSAVTGILFGIAPA